MGVCVDVFQKILVDLVVGGSLSRFAGAAFADVFGSHGAALLGFVDLVSAGLLILFEVKGPLLAVGGV